MVFKRSAGTPNCTRKSLAAVERRSPNARLYSADPRSSQWPSTTTEKFGSCWKICFNKAASLVRASRPSDRISLMSKSKKASCPCCCKSSVLERRGELTVGGGGGGALPTVTVTERESIP